MEAEHFSPLETHTPNIEERVEDDSSEEFYTTADDFTAHANLYHRSKLRRSLSVGNINLHKLTEIRYIYSKIRLNKIFGQDLFSYKIIRELKGGFVE